MPRCVLAGSHPARHYVLRRDLAVITAEHAAAFHLLKYSHLTHVPKRPITRSQSARARDPSFLLCNPAATLIAKRKGRHPRGCRPFAFCGAPVEGCSYLRDRPK